MKWLKFLMFLIGVLIVLVGLALILSVRIEEMREQGQSVGPGQWVALIDSIARLWNQIMIGVAQQYVTGITVLLIGIIVMSIPIALPGSKRS